MTDEKFLQMVIDEAKRARKKFPDNNAMNAALVEEVGEVSKALMYEPWYAVIAECVQVASMAMRLATEGDWTMTDFRREHVHQFGTRYVRPEFVMPGTRDLKVKMR